MIYKVTLILKTDAEAEFQTDFTSWLKKVESGIQTHVLLWIELGLQLTLAEVGCVTLPWKRALL